MKRKSVRHSPLYACGSLNGVSKQYIYTTLRNEEIRAL